VCLCVTALIPRARREQRAPRAPAAHCARLRRSATLSLRREAKHQQLRVMLQAAEAEAGVPLYCGFPGKSGEKES
jgi:hypothetical protein